MTKSLIDELKNLRLRARDEYLQVAAIDACIEIVLRHEVKQHMEGQSNQESSLDKETSQ